MVELDFDFYAKQHYCDTNVCNINNIDNINAINRFSINDEIDKITLTERNLLGLMNIIPCSARTWISLYDINYI